MFSTCLRRSSSGRFTDNDYEFLVEVDSAVYEEKAAKEAGATDITTSNEENNPMCRINIGLGFVPRPDWVMYEKLL